MNLKVLLICLKLACVLISLIPTAAGDAATNGNISFVTNHVYVQEKQYEQAVFHLRRDGGTNGVIFVACKILDNVTTTDFVDVATTESFPNGATSTTCVFTVVEDNIPEPNITYSIGITIVSGGAVVGSPSTAYVTILQNDDPYGRISFQNAGQMITVNEPSESQPAVTYLNIMRIGGTIGEVSVYWQVSPGLSAANLDLSPTSGMVIFGNGDRSKAINISILPDNVSEREEQFTIQLLRATGGAVINSTAKSVVIKIPANDPPLQFSVPSVTVAERQILTVRVTCGIINGTQIGSVLGVTAVNYTTQDGTARAGVDYQSKTGLLTFNSGDTEKTFDIAILKDPHPEILENFTVALSNPSSGSILGDPSTLVININKNDDPHGVVSFQSSNMNIPDVILDEDGTSSSVIQVNRSRGTFGTIMVQWRVVPGALSPTAVPHLTLNQTNGTLTFQAGVSIKHIELSALLNTIPNEAIEFYVELINVTGGARLDMTSSTFPRTRLIVRDSDNAYGDVNFGNQTNYRVILSSTPRRIIVPVQRSGGALGPIRINYTAIYVLPGSSVPSSDVRMIYPATLLMPTGVTNSTITIQIAEDSFLKNGAAFIVRLNNVQVEKSTIIAPRSPVIGAIPTAYVNITSELANGEIAFFNSPINMFVDEPVLNVNISLPLMRDGTAKQATVFWRVTPVSNTFTTADASPWSGSVYFPPGTDRANLTITIHPDDIPELDESFTVELANITGKNEKLRTGATLANVTIRKNDNPGGTFEFNFTRPSLDLQENEQFTLEIIRTGGMLTTQIVKVEIINGKQDFIAYQKILRFVPNETKKLFFVFANDDTLPEINETFKIVLSSIEGSVLGSRKEVNVTILQNDDANGIFSFVNRPTNLNQFAGEMKRSHRTVSFQITRDRGRFGMVSISWNVTSLTNHHPSFDIQPLSGSVDFSNGLSLKALDIKIKPDNIPEGEEKFQISLINATGGGKLKSPLQAMLTVYANDAPIYFMYPASIRIQEGQIANLTIVLNRTLTTNVTVTYSTIDGTASASSGDYDGFTNRTVVFLAGERTKNISIRTMEDAIPEISESFVVRLVASDGDTVVIYPMEATVTIEPNDVPYGVFQFSESSSYKIASEGDAVSFEIERSAGRFSNVTVSYDVISSRNMPVPANAEFFNPEGNVTFQQGSSRQSVNLQIRKDGVAELNETFYVRINNMSGDFAISNGARLGNRTEAVLLVLPSDDPFGVLEFATNSLEVSVAEDYLPGKINVTYANLTVQRTKGSFGSLQAVWQLYKASSVPNLPKRIWDLCFHGQRENAVTEVIGRNYSGTPGFSFNSSNASYMYIPSQNLPSSSTLSAGFSLSMWMKPVKGFNGTILSKHEDGTNARILSLTLNNISSTTELLIKVSNELYKISIPDSNNIFDGGWHSLILTFGRTDISVQIDGLEISRRTLSSVVNTSPGYFHIGCELPSSSHFTGMLQDVRLYTIVLTSGHITEISSRPKVITPLDAYLYFGNLIEKQNIFLKTIDNDIAEQNAVYSLRLIDIKGGGKLGETKTSSRITILKSDNANGQFAFSSTNCRTVAMENQTSLSFEVQRTLGQFGSVTVNWEIRQWVAGNPLASDDFSPSTGSVVFNQNENKKTITINPVDDSLPELRENFELRLVSVIPADGAVASSPSSGATIKPNFDRCNISLIANDYPYGLLQLQSARPTGVGVIPPLSSPLNVDVSEEAGNVTLYVVRAQGTTGTVTCEWKTNPATAQGNVDYTQSVGSLSLGPGVNSSRFSVIILDNAIPELEKTFQVKLYNPTGGAALGPASLINVTILPSDNAFGIFSFANSSSMVIANEAAGSVSLTIKREGGLLGVVNVTWRLVNGSADFGIQEGSVMFSNGQRQARFVIPITDDETPELSESFPVDLAAVSKGRIMTAKRRKTIKILASDDPYGVFELPPSSIRVTEGNTTVPLTITRQSGAIGRVRVYYQTVGSSTASAGIDYLPISESILFEDGQKSASFNVTILDDDLPEADEMVFVNLTKVDLINGTEVVSSSPRIGSSRMATILISANDNANGILQLSTSSVTVREGMTGPFLNLTRTGGAFSQVTVRFEVTNQGTTLGGDYSVSSFVITLSINQRWASVPVTIIDDDLPEFAESFVIKLVSGSVTGGAMIGSPNQCVVTIAENDYPYGLIGFASGSLNTSVTEPQSGAKQVTLTVVRSGGASGPAQVEWNATLNGRLVSGDLFQSRGNVVFLTGERSRDLRISVLADNVPEDNEPINVNLQYVSNGRAVINNAARTAVVNIEPNDNPYGVIQFAASQLTISEPINNTFIYLNVTRTRGLFGTVRIYYRTKTAVSATNKASPGNDFQSALDQTIQLGPGESRGRIPIMILSDNLPELNEQFLVEITKAETVGITPMSLLTVVNPSVMNVTISANDQPYGLFSINIEDTGTAGRSYAIVEPDSGTTSITFKVKRTQGQLGSVSVSWRVRSGSTVNTTTDVSGVSGGRFDFSENEAEKTFIINVNSDNIPETDEYLFIELYNPLGGAFLNRLEKEVTLIIKANDGVGGRIGFSSGSRSKMVKEGGSVSFSIYRTLPAAGNVTLNWTIEGANASLDFNTTEGKLSIPQGTSSISLLIKTKTDPIPEKNEQFTIRLSNPVTLGISSTGAAILVAGDATATVVIGANDEPHGIVEFAPINQPIRVKENVGQQVLKIVRNMGRIGDLVVKYRMKGVRISQTITAATQGEDYSSHANNSITIANGMDSGSIYINIINDNIPEQDEAFFVNLTSVELKDGGNVTVPPKLGSLRSMQIQIEANDGTQGELAFAPEFERKTVSERIKSFNITVLRYKGNFGDVYAFYQLNRLTASLSDFFIPGGVMSGPAKLTFENGQRERNITVFITNDNITEPEEQFEIGLTIQNAVNNGGVTIGNISKSLITIAANDDANGVIGFATSSLTQAINEPESTSSGNKTAIFVIERNVGAFGVVNVRWDVIGVNVSSDVTPTNGRVSFLAGEKRKEFRVTALQDDVPELDKIYSIQISVVSGGARLGVHNRATLIIAANDAPNGLLSIRSYPSLSRSLNVEESSRYFSAVVQRTGGTIGQVSVQYETRASTAVSSVGLKMQFGFDQVLSTSHAESFHSFSVNGKMYLLLASSYRKQQPGKVGASSIQEPYQSTLFRWQGTFVPIMSLLTDGAVKWESFKIGHQYYFISINHGSVGRYETSSQIFRFHSNETVQLIQNITTKGASDALVFHSNGEDFLLMANEIDNAGSTNLRTQLFKWQGIQFILESFTMSTSGASSVTSFSINNMLYVAVANRYDSARSTYSASSSVYLWSAANKRFTLSYSIGTQGASDVDFMTIEGDSYLFLTNSKSASRLYRYKTTSPLGFQEVQEMDVANARTGKLFSWNQTAYLVIAANTSVLYRWDVSSKSFNNLTNLPVKNAMSIVPFTANDSISGSSQYLAVAMPGDVNSFVLRLAMLSGNADYVSRRGELTFYDGQSSLKLDFTILKDNLPEMDERFAVNLLNPKGGSKLAANPNLEVNILSNDNAYGRLAFADSSLRVNVSEYEWDSVLSLRIVREFGSFGQVSVHWNISSLSGRPVTDLYTTNRQMNLMEGISSGNILVYVRGDRLPELNEVFFVSLTSVAIAGAPNSNRGPTINYLKNVATVTILANDDPHGVIEWKNKIEITTEETEVNSSALLVITRQYGTLGDVLVSYETVQATKVAANERIAVPGVDYFSKTSTVLMEQGVREAFVYITVRHDNNTADNEIFHVNITNVRLVSGTPVPNSPRINADKNQVEVVITEAVLNRGVIEFAGPAMISTKESVGILQIPLIRVNGSQGTVGVHFKVSGINASSADFSPQAGIVTFSNGSRNANLSLTIVDDSLPELNEMLDVELTKPSGGVKLGSRKMVRVLIAENDYPYGLISFNPASRRLRNVTEGSTISLTVDRRQGLHRTINVGWSCTAQAQNDLRPWSGNLVIAENATSAVISIEVINDSTPEITETFTCTLLSANNGAEISLDNTANITVVANDKPHGVISVDSVSRVLAVGEPMSSGYNGQFSITLRRSVGFDGLVEVNWRITSSSGNGDLAGTFNVTSGTVSFPSGGSVQKINFQVKDDNKPEESELYVLTLESTTGGAELDTSANATKSFITVVASEEPYGTIQFQPPYAINVSENAGHINLTLTRSGGVIGRLRVRYATSSTTASPGADFSPRNGEIEFNAGERVKYIIFNIENDSIPELTETFKVNITQVSLITTRKMNYGMMNGLQVDVPPKIGQHAMVEVSINENDDPYGTIEFTQVARLVHERDGRVLIAVNRTGGAFGSSTVGYTYTSFNATNPDDFTVIGTSLTFAQGERQKFITVNIVDDRISEFQESFSLDLTSITGKARLGSKTRLTITIETSDNPYGLFGIFNTSLSVSIPNPVVNQNLSFPLSRVDGALGRSEVRWRIVRNLASSSAITEDITPDQGSLVFEANEGGSKLIKITILPFGGLQEPEEKFTLNVYSASGGASLDHAVVNVSITVSKKGHPNGLFSMQGSVSPASTVSEPQSGVLVVTVPVMRGKGTTGLVHVRWSITSSTGTIGQDIRIANNTLTFQNGDKTKNIMINVIADDLPELDEVYQVTLVSADNGAEIDSLRGSVNFTVRANGYPHGLFQTTETGKRFEFNPVSQVRALNFTIERKNGTIGRVQTNIDIQYSADGSTDAQTAVFNAGQNMVHVSFSIPPGRFLIFGSNFTIQLRSVSLLTSASSMAPAVDSTSPSIVIGIPEEAANSIIEFGSNSRMLSASNSSTVSNVLVSRLGLFGAISVNWRSGYPAGGFTIGTLNPSQGTVSFVQGERSKAFSFSASIPSVLQNNLIYAVYLSSVSPTNGQPAWPKIGSANTAIVEPHGVLEIAQNHRTLTVTEGRKATIQIRRLLSTMEKIRVHYATQKYTGANAAVENVDFTPVTSYVDMNQGQTTANIEIQTLEDSNSLPERDEMFYVRLTSVEVVPSSARRATSSPRISANNRSTITIRDNDSPFGIISFTSQSSEITTQESSGNVTLNLRRTGGVFSRVTVLVRSIGGGEPWQSEVLSALPSNSPIRSAISARSKAASALSPNRDYIQLNKQITFPVLNTIPVGGQMKSVNLSILQDSLSEPAEQLVVAITILTGGARLPTVTEKMQAFSVITIDGNGLWNGEIGFTTKKTTVNEDQSAQVIIPLQRNKGSAELTEVKWNAWIPNGNLANQLNKTSGNTSFAAGSSTSSITVQLKKDSIPEFASWFFVNLTTNAKGAVIAGAGSPLSSYCNVTILESDYPAGRIGFNSRYSIPVVNFGDTNKQLRVRRYDGALKDVTVRYQTVALTTVINEGGVIMTPAVENRDFMTSVGILNFPKGSIDAFINLQLTPGTASAGSYPKVFNVTLYSPTNGAILYGSYQYEQVIISKDTQTTYFLKLRSDALKRPLSDSEIESILTRILTEAKKPPLNQKSQNLIMRTIRLIVAYKLTLPAGSKALTVKSKNTLLDIFDTLLSTSRTDTRGQSAWAILLDELAYNFLTELKCPASYTGSKTNFALTSRRGQGNQLNGVKFSGKNSKDFFRYPVNMFSSSAATCTDIHFIDYANQQFFSSEKILNNKVMSSAIKSGLSSGMKVVYRVHTSKTRVSKTGVRCVIWNHATAAVKGDWNTKNCIVKGQTESYVECECAHLSQYAVLALSDNRTGYEIYFFVSCFICIGACFLAVMSMCCNPERTFAANLLVYMIVSVMLTNIVYVVGAYMSPTWMGKSELECGILGLAMHYCFTAQFALMFVQAYNLFRILVFNDEHTDRKIVEFSIFGWGVPLLLVVGYVITTRAAYSWSFNSMYGDVHQNGDMCFIPNANAAVGAVIVPVLLFIFGVITIFIQSYLVKPQWKCYDDIFRDRYNYKEVKYLFILFSLLTITWTFAGLHLAYGSLWMITSFSAFNIFLGLYILVQYAIIRNVFIRNMILQCCGNDALCCGNDVLCCGKYDPQVDHSSSIHGSNLELIYAPSSLNRDARMLADSRKMQPNQLSNWEDIDIPINLEPIDYEDKRRILNSAQSGRIRGHVNESYDDDIESDEFDDLIFALNTGRGMSPSIQEEQELEEKEKPASPRPTSTDQVNVRRIKIADTHL